MEHQARMPEELLRQILAHNLALPDAALTGHERPPPPCGAVHQLLASRQLRRVGTPLLYAAVHVRTPAQLHALARALRANPPLGALVRCLRLDAAPALMLGRVALCLPGVHTLVLGIGLCGWDHAPYPAADLRAALGRMPVRRLVVVGEDVEEDARGGEVMRVVADAVGQWGELVGLFRCVVRVRSVEAMGTGPSRLE